MVSSLCRTGAGDRCVGHPDLADGMQDRARPARGRAEKRTGRYGKLWKLTALRGGPEVSPTLRVFGPPISNVGSDSVSCLGRHVAAALHALDKAALAGRLDAELGHAHAGYGHEAIYFLHQLVFCAHVLMLVQPFYYGKGVSLTVVALGALLHRQRCGWYKIFNDPLDRCNCLYHSGFITGAAS